MKRVIIEKDNELQDSRTRMAMSRPMERQLMESRTKEDFLEKKVEILVEELQKVEDKLKKDLGN